MNEPIGIYAEQTAKREALVARLSPAARHQAFPGIYRRPTGEATETQLDPVSKALREENRMLRAENVRLRAKLAAKVGIAAVGAPTMEAVIFCFIRTLAETEYSTETGRITLADLQSNRKSRPYSRPRHVAMWCVRKICRYASLPMIAREFAKSDHTVVKHGCTRIQKKIDSDPFWRDIATKVLAAFGEKL